VRQHGVRIGLPPVPLLRGGVAVMGGVMGVVVLVILVILLVDLALVRTCVYTQLLLLLLISEQIVILGTSALFHRQLF